MSDVRLRGHGTNLSTSLTKTKLKLKYCYVTMLISPAVSDGCSSESRKKQIVHDISPYQMKTSITTPKTKHATQSVHVFQRHVAVPSTIIQAFHICCLFKYHSAVICENVRERIRIAAEAVVLSRNLSKSLKLKLYPTIVVGSVVTYGSRNGPC